MYNKIFDDLHLGSGNMCNVLSPGSVLLSANGTMAFKSCPRYEDMASFTAPELQQGHAASTRTAIEKVSQSFVDAGTQNMNKPQNQIIPVMAKNLASSQRFKR